MEMEWKSRRSGVEVTYDMAAVEHLELGEGIVLPNRFHAKLNPAELPYHLDLEIVFDGDRFVCESMLCRRRPGEGSITTEGLREIPVTWLIRISAEMLLYRGRGGAAATQQVLPAFDAEFPDGPTDDALQQVAGVYRLAYVCGEPPTKTVEQRFKLARSTAGRWISMARKKGYLRETTPGKAAG